MLRENRFHLVCVITISILTASITNLCLTIQKIFPPNSFRPQIGACLLRACCEKFSARSCLAFPTKNIWKRAGLLIDDVTVMDKCSYRDYRQHDAMINSILMNSPICIFIVVMFIARSEIFSKQVNNNFAYPHDVTSSAHGSPLALVLCR